MMENPVIIEKEGAVGMITMSRPSALNSLNGDMVEGLMGALRQLAQDSKVRVIILTGAGKGFCAGGDLFHLQSIEGPIESRQFIAEGGAIIDLIMNMEKPVIAMVNGVAAGAGFNLALACDIVFCAKSARFAQSFVKVGLVPDYAGLYLLPRLIGPHKAKELMFTADLIDSARADSLGLVNRVVDDSELSSTTREFAERLAQAAPVAIGLMKRAINRNDNLDLRDSLELEANMQCICMQTLDHREGVAAFKEKRTPQFSGR